MKKVLVIAAHPDDDILGCGATMARHTSEGDEVSVLFISDGETARGNKDLSERKKAATTALAILGARAQDFLDFPDNQLDTVPLLSVVKKIENVIQQFQPNIIYTHHFGDLNVDHKITHKAVVTACRPLPSSKIESIYAFEVLSSTEWADEAECFKPTHFVNVEKFWKQKMEAIAFYQHEMRSFPHARSSQNLEALAIHRGATVGLPKAEAFQLIRSIN